MSQESAEERARSRAAVVMARVSHQMANARKDSTVTQVGLAKLADVSPETISRLENGDGWADTYSIIRLGLELGVDFEVVDAQTRRPIGRFGHPQPE